MDADDFLNFLLDGGGGGGGGGIISDAFAAASAPEALLKTDPALPLIHDAALTSSLGASVGGVARKNSLNTTTTTATSLMTLDTPVFESLTEDFFAGLLGNNDGGLDTIDPDQVNV